MKYSNIICASYVVSVLHLVSCLLSVPLIIASHKLVKGAKDTLLHDASSPFSVEEATNVIKKIVTQCSSDAYIVVNIPGLRAQDLTMDKNEMWPSLRRHMSISSTLIGLPWVTAPIDLEYIESYITRTCDAITMLVDEDSEGPEHYFDTETRLLKLLLSPLPSLDEPEKRASYISKYDSLIRKTIRMIPTPRYTLLVTSSSTEVVHLPPEEIIEADPDSFQIFNDIINAPSRKSEAELNDYYRATMVPPSPPPKRHTNDRYIRNKKDSQVHFFDADLWIKNSKVILTIVTMILSLFILQLLPSIKKAFLISSSSKSNLQISIDKKRN